MNEGLNTSQRWVLAQENFTVMIQVLKGADDIHNMFHIIVDVIANDDVHDFRVSVLFIFLFI
jgi:hypothetical protein